MKLKTFKNKLLIACTILSTIIYLTWRIFFTVPFEHGIISIISGLSLLIVEILGTLELMIHFRNMSNIEYPQKPDVDENLFPDIDVFIATYNEPVDLLYKTINGCINMDYPDKSKVHIYLCDDGNRTEMRQLAESMNINYTTRSERKHAKAGNLNNALANSKSPLVVTFDADMIPMHDFLMICTPYFLTGEKIGFVQTPQSFYNPDLFQYNLFSEGRIPNEQDYFYRDIQVSKNKSDSVIYGGSNTVISRKALEEIGGFYTETITEDFATGMYIQSKGYKCYSIDEVHASGLSPADLKSLIKQRQRWARGCIQTGKKLNILFKKGLNLEQKLSYISAISYWYSGIKRLIYIMSPILFAVFGVVVVKCNLLQVLVFWLPMYLFNNASLKKLSRNIRSTKWTNIYETILFPSLILPVLLETFGFSEKKFSVTRKDGALDDKSYQFKKAIPHIIFAILSIIGMMNCIRWIFSSGSPTYVVVLFWLIVNFYNILMALFFMLGRKIYRKSERITAEVDCTISYDETEIKCKTVDVSEGGIAISLDFPKYIPYNSSINLALSTERYGCKVKGQIIYVEKVREAWKYVFKLTEIEEEHFKQLLLIIYDRVPSLPKTIEKNNSIYDDIRLNIITRTKKASSLNRKLPRIELEKTCEVKEVGKVKIMNFNYEYVVLKTNYLNRGETNITIPIFESVALECVLEKTLNYEDESRKSGKVKNNHQIMQLYKIKNYDDIIKYDELNHVLIQWINDSKYEKVNRKLEEKKNNLFNELDEMAYL